jgi:hypothetical protein
MKFFTIFLVLFALGGSLFAQEKAKTNKQNKSTVLGLSKQKAAKSTDNYFGNKSRFENYFPDNKLPVQFPSAQTNETKDTYLKRVSFWAENNKALFKNNSANSFLLEMSNLSKE